MRTLIQVQHVASAEGNDCFLAVADDGTLWRGMLTYKDTDLIVKWTQLNTPPDGDFLEHHKDRWDQLEEQIRSDDETDSPD